MPVPLPLLPLPPPPLGLPAATLPPPPEDPASELVPASGGTTGVTAVPLDGCDTYAGRLMIATEWIELGGELAGATRVRGVTCGLPGRRTGLVGIRNVG